MPQQAVSHCIFKAVYRIVSKQFFFLDKRHKEKSERATKRGSARVNRAKLTSSFSHAYHILFLLTASCRHFLFIGTISVPSETSHTVGSGMHNQHIHEINTVETLESQATGGVGWEAVCVCVCVCVSECVCLLRNKKADGTVTLKIQNQVCFHELHAHWLCKSHSQTVMKDNVVCVFQLFL